MNSSICLALSLGAVAVSVAPAAAQSFTLGAKGGATVANVQVVATDLTLDPGERVGLVAGAFAGKDLGAGFGVQIEGLLTQKGTTIRDPRFPGDLQVKLAYVDVPVLARYRLTLSQRTAVHFLAGPVFSLKVGDSQRIGGDEVPDEEKQVFRSGDLGLSVGGAFEFARTSIDVRYVFGVPNINDDIDRDELIVRTRTLAVTAGWRWK